MINVYNYVKIIKNKLKLNLIKLIENHQLIK